MAKTKRPAGAFSNALLSHLSSETIASFARHLEPLRFDVKWVLHEPEQRMQYAYFPEAGMVSVVSIMDDGRSIEVGTIGREGMTGAAILFTADRATYQYYIQIAGNGYRIKAALLKVEAEQNSELRTLLFHYQAAFLTQTMQAAACNGLHNIQQRCCRWILMCQDRVDSETIPLTHEFLGLMLGVRRASVSEVLQPLQTRGWIRSKRGQIAILNRKGLESGSCECYRLIAKQYADLVK
jgi:CRP-like cAMP-binding protein